MYPYPLLLQVNFPPCSSMKNCFFFFFCSPTWSAYWLKDFPWLNPPFDDSFVGSFSLCFLLVLSLWYHLFQNDVYMKNCDICFLIYVIGWLLTFRLLLWSIFPFVVHKVPRTKGSGFWLPVIQVVASFLLLLSIVVEISSLCLCHLFSVTT